MRKEATREMIPVKEVQGIILYELRHEQSQHESKYRKALVEDGMKAIGFDVDSWSKRKNFKF